ncbi:hypothetical protein MHY1_03215 [Methylovirgula sp. HY1]|nr:hypothetical protein MHY1_03215 [Methylovirgula sp. HY1]
MPDDQPEEIVLHLLRDIRERIEPMATKDDIADLRSELNSGLANVAADLHELDAKIDATRKDLSDQIVGLRRAVVEYHSAVIGHGNIIAELEARVRRMEQHLGLEGH